MILFLQSNHLLCFAFAGIDIICFYCNFFVLFLSSIVASKFDQGLVTVKLQSSSFCKFPFIDFAVFVLSVNSLISCFTAQSSCINFFSSKIFAVFCGRPLLDVKNN